MLWPWLAIAALLILDVAVAVETWRFLRGASK